MKKFLILLVAILGISASANAQSFGVRLIGVQYNTFDPGKGTGLQVALSTFFFAGVDLEVNYIIGRENLSDDRKFTFYYGAGVHAGFLGFGFNQLSFGAHGVLGLEYLLQPTISIGFGVHPGVSINPGFVFPVTFYYGGLFFVNFKI
jgi:hypothetical protein